MIRRGIGIQSFVSAGVSTDADAQAFITAAGITDATQQSAINTLVTDLKGYGIWTKMKAIYPFVGGTSSTHKWNLRDPRDLDAAFRLVFSGGITHSSTGALFNGTNGWSDTFLNANTNLTNGNFHLSFYSRTNNTSQAYSHEIVLLSGFNPIGWVSLRNHNKSLGNAGFSSGNDNNEFATASNTSAGFGVGTETSSSLRKLIKNGTIIATNTTTSTTSLTSAKLTLMGNNSVAVFSNNEAAFASIGDGLTDTEAANLYTAVQAYQTTLGRSVGTQTVSDSDAQAFVNAAVIEDQVQATAINTLVTDLKGYGIWTKMKAIYPMVGGTASTHKWNLKDPRDLDAAFRLVFNGGGTHSSTGYTPNGVNGYGDTFLTLSAAGAFNNCHISYYSRTDNLDSITRVEIGRGDNNANGYFNLFLRLNNSLANIGGSAGSRSISVSNSNSACFGINSATSSTSQKIYKNGSLVTSTTTTQTTTAKNLNIFIGSQGGLTGAAEFSNRECAFASIGDGLTDTEAANLYTAVQAYQTTLSRNV